MGIEQQLHFDGEELQIVSVRKLGPTLSRLAPYKVRYIMSDGTESSFKDLSFNLEEAMIEAVREATRKNNTGKIMVASLGPRVRRPGERILDTIFRRGARYITSVPTPSGSPKVDTVRADNPWAAKIKARIQS